MTDEMKAERERIGRNVGDILGRIRKSAGLTQRDLAKRLGTSASYVTRLERAERGCELADAMLWAKACGVEFRTAIRAVETGDATTAEQLDGLMGMIGTLAPETAAAVKTLVASAAPLNGEDLEALTRLAQRLAR